MTDKIIGVLAIVLGFVLIFYALSELLLRLCVALVGIWFIQYGFKLYGKGSLYTRAHNWYSFRKF
jgi:uncharacterized membrane protein HdeD (DUF308 family)